MFYGIIKLIKNVKIAMHFIANWTTLSLFKILVLFGQVHKHSIHIFNQ